MPAGGRDAGLSPVGRHHGALLGRWSPPQRRLVDAAAVTCGSRVTAASVTLRSAWEGVGGLVMTKTGLKGQYSVKERV